MNAPLAHWLIEQRAALLPRWIALLNPTPAVVASGMSAYDLPELDEPATHPDEQQIVLTSIYDSLVQAADGDTAALDERMQLLRAFRTTPGEEALPRHIEIISRLRRVAWDAIAADVAPGWYQIGVEFDQLIEYATVSLATNWVGQAASTTQELQETRLLVESLSHEAEASDRTTLHVSRINEISKGLSATFDQAQQIAIVGNKLAETLEGVEVSIWQRDQNDCLRIAQIWEPGTSSTDQAAPDWCIPINDPHDILASAFHGSDMLIVQDPDQATQGAWYRAAYVVLVMPLIFQGHASGLIVLQEQGGMALLERSEQEFIRSAASQAAIALENARLYAEVRGFNAVLEQRIAERTNELQVERDTLETLNTIALETSSTLDEHLLMQHSLGAIAQLVDATHGSISLLDRETDQLVVSAVLGRTDNVGYTRFPIGLGILGWVAQHRKSALVPDIQADPRWIDLPHTEDSNHKRTGSMLVVPLIAHYELQGVMVLSHDQPGFFTEEHLRLSEASSSQIATGIHNALMYKQVEQDLLRRYEMQQAQEQAVSQSNAILQSLSDGVIVCDGFGSVITVNPAAERILERPLEELLIWNMPELFRRLMGRRADELPVEALLNDPRDAQGNPQVFSSIFQINKRVVSATLNPVLSSEKHTPIGALTVFRDITREVESDRLKTEFIGTVSHELRTPMTSIKGFTQLLAMGSLGPTNETQREFLGIIQNNAERMIAIINDLLDITKIETGSVELDMRPLHLAEALSNVVMELQPKIKERGHELTISLPPGLPLVRADQRRFNQILLNLVSNAIKYTPRNGMISLDAREISLDLVPEALHEGLKTGRYVQVEVRDTGVGIAPEEIERIFERFYRTENPLKVEAGGTGLGLALVRPLVSLFGGRIWVVSKLGEGSSFRFILPAL
jgi:signal transduction histidine kinase